MRTLAAASVLVLAVAASATAQERSIADADLPRAVSNHLQSLFGRADVMRMDGPARVEADRTISGALAVSGGELTIAGKVEGEVVVVDGDLVLQPGAVVGGDVTVVNGEVQGLDSARVSGTITTYGRGVRYAYGDEKHHYSDGHRWRSRHRYAEEYAVGSRFAVDVAPSYNRVEGLPISFGPVVETRGPDPLRLEAKAIWRSEAGFHTEQMGYLARLEQSFANRQLRIGGTASSVIDPIETWGMRDFESSLSTFLLHYDYRDYFQRRGFSTYMRVKPRATPFDLTVQFRQEDHESVAARDPWSVFNNGDGWRAQPLVAEGRIRSLGGQLKIDTRNDDSDPAMGWFVSGGVEHGLGGSLHTVAAYNPMLANAGIPSTPVNVDFNSGFIDVRTYNRVGFGSRLNLRGALAGSLDGKALPAQFQRVLGGAASLPGYSAFSADCGVRRAHVVRVSDDKQTAFYPAYGCDRVALFQAEFRGSLHFDFGYPGWDGDWDWHVDADPSWVAFFDAGRGWALDGPASFGRADTGNLYDAGVGVLLGDVGVYAAVPLTGRTRTLNIFVRLGSRF
jgi:hypothetical protein